MSSYRQFHGLCAPAFGKAIGRSNLLVYPHLEEFADEMDTLLEDGGVGELSGEMGIGKTTALRWWLGRLEERSCQVCYAGSNRHATALLQGLVENLGVSPARHRAALLRQVSQRVERAFHEQRKKTLVILDDAHLLEDGLLEDMRLLTNFEMDAQDALVLLLVGHPALRKKLQQPVHLALWDRLRMRYRLEGLSRDETSAYIDHHLRVAGGNPELFTADARDAVFEAAQGIPRRINTLAMLALKKSASRRVTPIDGAFVATVLSLVKSN
ncbi:MAG: AAA family ATPase [Deltaproteobacteria bacterium]|nr:AAA family ATPase [Deltaproteobacteria bacterium]